MYSYQQSYYHNFHHIVPNLVEVGKYPRAQFDTVQKVLL